MAQAATVTGPSLTGSVLRNGEGVSGATVIEYAWPNDDVLAGLRTGDTVPMIEVGAARTGFTGGYAVTVDMAALGARYREVDGSVDIETDVAAGASSTTYSTVVSTAQVSAARVLDAETFDLGRATIRDGNGIRTTGAIHLGVATTRASLARPDGAAPYCSETDLGSAVHSEIYGQQNGNPNVWGWEKENSGTTHSIELAVDVNGEGWTGSGSASAEVRSDSGAVVPRHGYSQQNLNTINDREYHDHCTDFGHVTDSYQWRAIETRDLNSSWRRTTHPYYTTDCEPVQAGGSHTASKGVTVSYSLGMEINGVHLTVKDAFETSVEDNFLWVKQGYFCGNSTRGTTHSSLLEGHQQLGVGAG